MEFLPTAASVFVTFSAWQSKNLAVLISLHDLAKSEAERQAYENAITLFQDSPVTSSYAVNSEVMEREIVLEDSENEYGESENQEFDNSDVTIPPFDYDEPVQVEGDTCDCPACQMRRAIEKSLKGNEDTDADIEDNSKLNGIEFLKLLAALANAKR